MAAFNGLDAGQVSQTTEIHAVFTGREHHLTPKDKAKCKAYLDHVNSEREKKGEKPFGNGDIYTTVAEQITNDGKLLLLSEKTNYAHFLAFSRRNSDPMVKEIFGSPKNVPPCPLANPQTFVLAKPESEVAKEQGGKVKKILGSLKSKSEVILGVMGKETSFEGVAQAAGAALNAKNMKSIAIDHSEVIRELEGKGFKIEADTIVHGANRWDLTKITDQSLQTNMGIVQEDKVGDSNALVAVRDSEGNYYLTSVTPVNKTAKEIVAGKPAQSKFSKLVRVPADPQKAQIRLAMKNIKSRVYVEPALQQIRNMIQTRSLFDMKLRGAEKVGAGRVALAKAKENMKGRALKINPLRRKSENRESQQR